MRIRALLRHLHLVLLPVAASAACDSGEASSSATDAGPTGSNAPGGDAADYFEPTSCALRDDPGGPGQYNDGCVKRSWIAPYAGAYASTRCLLTIAIDGSVAATFAMKVLSGALAGDYTTAWDGAAGPANDLYLRYTTDGTFARTETLTFNAGQKLGTSDERNLTLRVESLDTGAPVFKGRYAQVVGGKSDEFDCETLTKK